MAYFTADLDRAITSNKLYMFTEVPQLYTELTAAVTPKKQPQDREQERNHVQDRDRDTCRNLEVGKGNEAARQRPAGRGGSRDDNGFDDSK